jgi:hypothetical protein
MTGFLNIIRIYVRGMHVIPFDMYIILKPNHDFWDTLHVSFDNGQNTSLWWSERLKLRHEVVKIIAC